MKTILIITQSEKILRQFATTSKRHQVVFLMLTDQFMRHDLIVRALRLKLLC
jgi:hypothetical protein